VVPRDSGLIKPVTTQNGPEFFHEAIGGQVRQTTALAPPAAPPTPGTGWAGLRVHALPGGANGLLTLKAYG